MALKGRAKRCWLWQRASVPTARPKGSPTPAAFALDYRAPIGAVVAAGREIRQANDLFPEGAAAKILGPIMMERHAMCLRCSGVELVPSGPSVQAVEFFDCPACHRRYARKPGGSLTFRWLHPISLVLYEILFDSNPLQRLEKSGVPSKPPEVLLRIVEEIELELTHPTQQVRDILDNLQTEEQCRQYLREYVTRVRGWLQEKQGDQG